MYIEFEELDENLSEKAHGTISRESSAMFILKQWY